MYKKINIMKCVNIKLWYQREEKIVGILARSVGYGLRPYYKNTVSTLAWNIQINWDGAGALI